MLASASMALLLGTVQQPGRQRTILPNGARLQVEATNHNDRAAVAMAVTLAGLTQEEMSHGKVHLLEHLAARGPNRDLDQRLEEEGMSLTVATTRDAMVFHISCRPRQIAFALEGLASLAVPLALTPGEIAKEITIMREEQVLTEGHQKMARAAWNHVFASDQSDPMGFPEEGKADPDALAKVHTKMFEGKGISVAIAGGVDVASAFDRASKVFSALPAGRDKEAPLRSASFAPRKLIVSGMKGAARAALSEGIDTTPGLAALGSSLAVSFWMGEGSPFFTPSLWRGLIYLTAPRPESFRGLDSLTSSQRQSLHPLVLSSLEGYFKGIRRSPESLSEFQATLALQNPALTLSRLEQLSKSITPAQVDSSLEAFTQAKSLQLESGL